MKSFSLLVLGAGVAMAQSLSDLPPCGQTCISNMISIATTEFGCSQGDIICYCTNVDFGNGVRDCSNESCPNSDATAVIEYGTNFCKNALQSAASTASVATTGGALDPLTSALATITGSADASATGSADASATGSAGGAQSTAITTEPLVATITSGDSTFETTTGFSTVYSRLPESDASAASSLSESAASAASSISRSAASAASSVSESGASAASSIASQLSSALASATGGSASSTAGAAKMTGLPIAGAAGIAAWLLL